MVNICDKFKRPIGVANTGRGTRIQFMEMSGYWSLEITKNGTARYNIAVQNVSK